MIEYIAAGLCILIIVMAIIDVVKWVLKPKTKPPRVVVDETEALRTKLYGKSR